MSAQLKPRLTPEEYLAIERQAEYKSEYYRGEMFAMSGASKEHNLIAGNVFAALHAQLRKRPCQAYTSDMRVKVSPTGLYTYPDVIVVCGEAQFEDKQVDTLLNPTVIVEVLSPSTEAHDRGWKFEQYRKLASLQEYILIAQDKYHVEHYVRQADDQWVFSETERLSDTIHLPAINCDLAVADVYEKVEIVVNAEGI
jgi:Uma2 family endonuclease